MSKNNKKRRSLLIAINTKNNLNIYQNLNELPSFRNAVITIGSFDGVHFGHQRILRQVRELAAQYNGESVVVTFDPHPRLVIYPDDDSLHLLTSTQKKCELLEKSGINHVVLVRFTPEFAQQSPEDYIQNFLVKNFQPKHIVIGYDHHFGENRKGNIDLLQMLAPKYGYNVVEISKQEIDDIAVSSTKIRLALDKGDIQAAQNLLAHDFSFTGTVVKGQQLGRTIGYPTANIQPDDRHQLIPANGIYAATIEINHAIFKASLYIGTRPTLNGETRTIEAFIFDFDEDIYDQNVKLNFVKYIRPDKKLESLDALKSQIAKDNKKVLAVF